MPQTWLQRHWEGVSRHAQVFLCSTSIQWVCTFHGDLFDLFGFLVNPLFSPNLLRCAHQFLELLDLLFGSQQENFREKVGKKSFGSSAVEKDIAGRSRRPQLRAAHALAGHGWEHLSERRGEPEAGQWLQVRACVCFLLQPPLPWGHGAEALLHGSLPSHSCGEGVSTHPALLQGGWVGACRQKGKDTRRAKDAFTSQKGPKARQTWGERKEERERERESQNHRGREESREEVKPNGHKQGRVGTTTAAQGKKRSSWAGPAGSRERELRHCSSKSRHQAQQYHAGFVLPAGLKAQQYGNVSPASLC